MNPEVAWLAALVCRSTLPPTPRSRPVASDVSYRSDPPSSQRVVGIVVRHEQRVERIADPVAGRERIHPGHVPIPAQRQSPPGCVAQHGESAGDPLIAEAVPNGAVEIGELDGRQSHPVPEAQRESLDPVVSEGIGEPLIGESVRPLPGHRVGQPLGQVGQSRLGLANPLYIGRISLQGERVLPAIETGQRIVGRAMELVAPTRPAIGRGPGAGVLLLVRATPSTAPLGLERVAAGLSLLGRVLGRSGRSRVNAIGRPVLIVKSSKVVVAWNGITRSLDHREPDPSRDDLAVGHPVAPVLEGVLQVGIDVHELVGEAR